MSFVDKIHYCWEQCCDLGPHACVCGNDCESDEGSEGRVMTDCAFCQKIGNWDFEQHYAAREVVRFTPLNPVTPGHMLFVPGEHAEHPDFLAVKIAVGYAARYGTQQGEDYNLITSSGVNASQTVPHIHVHYVPRRDGDGLHLPCTGQHG